MPSVSITRLRVRAVRHMFSFAWHAMRSQGQARRAEGFLAGATAQEKGGLIFWTVTVWRDADAMRAFRNSGAHMKAMPRLIAICNEASYGHWQQDTTELPSLEEMHRQMHAVGKRSKVHHPTAAHDAGQLATDRVPGSLRVFAPAQ